MAIGLLASPPWANTSLTVPRFEGHTNVHLQVPATYDFDVLAAKYLNALAAGAVPVELLFSGTVFYQDGEQSGLPLGVQDGPVREGA